MMVHQPESAATLVALQSVSQCYPGRQGMVKVLDEVSLSVCQGDFIAITGESGSGKSTLLNIIGLLMPPSSGVVSYQGRPVSFGRGAEVAQRAAGRPIGFVFQQFNLIPSLSVLDNVALPLLYQGLAPAVRAAQSLAVLETLGAVPELKNRLRLIPYSAVGAASGLLPVFRPDSLMVDGKKREGVMIAVAPASAAWIRPPIVTSSTALKATTP